MKKNVYIFILLSLFTLTNFCYAKNYFVANTGNDTNPGTFASPFKTIQKGVDMAALGGDTVFVSAGFYPESVKFIYSGNTGNYIVFKAMGEVTIECTVNWLWSCVFDLTNKNYIIIDGFKIQNTFFFGIYVYGCNQIILRNNWTYNTGASGIYMEKCTSIKILNNKVEKACALTKAQSSVGIQENISVSLTTDFEIAYNEVVTSGKDNTNESWGGEGLDVKAGCQNGSIHQNIVHDLNRLGIYCDSWNSLNKNINIYDNTVWNCREGIVLSSEDGGTVDSVQVYNNICYANEQSGIAIANYGTDGPKTNITIMNNTCYENGFQIYINGSTGGGITISSSSITNVIVRNNIVSKNNRWQILTTGTIVKDHNLIDGYKGALQEVEIGPTDVKGDPCFTNPLENDFTLLGNSPAIDKADPILFTATDFAGNSRTHGLSADIGAFEYMGVTGIINYKSNSFGFIFPNPASESININLNDMAKNQQVQFYNTTGQLYKEIVIEQSAQVNIFDLPKGIYFIQIKGFSQRAQKFIKL